MRTPELEIDIFRKIVNFDTTWIIPISFKFVYTSLCTQVYVQNLKYISEVYGSSYFCGLGQNLIATCFYLKMEVLLWHQYQLIHRYENLRFST